ncbi:MAG: MarR family transcriptional regulator [Microthrixaceae bacterium]
MDDSDLAANVRAFNRFYTEAIGSLDEDHEGLDITLAQARVLFSVSAMEPCSVNDIADKLRLDLAYTSRVLGTLEDRSLIRRTISQQDRRQRVVTMTVSGRMLLRNVERRSDERMLGLLAHLDAAETTELLAAMDTIRALLTKPTPTDGDH